ERTERQRELEGSRLNIQQRIQDGEKDVKLLQQEVEAINRSADRAVEDSEKMFTELIQKRSSDVKQQVRSQQESEVSRVKEFQEKLEQEITELKRKDADLKQLTHTEDHTQFLQNYPAPIGPKGPIYLPAIDPFRLRHFDGVQKAISDFTNKLTDNFYWKNISHAVTEVDVLLSQEPKTRGEFLKYSCQIKLDPNTANSRLLLSKKNRKVTFAVAQGYPSHPDRFTTSVQVLSRESLTGRCYWEVEKGTGGVLVVVAYKDKNLVDKTFGNNDTSWALGVFKSRYEFKHNNITTSLSGPLSSRVGVYLDHTAGNLCFFSISETLTLLHRVRTTFTQPLYAGLLVNGPIGNTAEMF
ncbi:tripartite motif-containing protein 16-like, partial [Cottoperca gobio]|uniref:Tripartite motif-containing protein 16-like n=1 Tax=Cottoperca gobio TaxID=56716 RepID=A0A6J2RG14_COTGO